MIESLADQVELNSLMMVANKQNHLTDARQRLKSGVASMAAMAGMNGSPVATVDGEGDDSAIINRSPRTDTTNNNYPVKSDAPWVALIALGLMTAGALWWASQPKATPSTPANPGGVTPATPVTSKPGKSDPNYIEFYHP